MQKNGMKKKLQYVTKKVTIWLIISLNFLYRDFLPFFCIKISLYCNFSGVKCIRYVKSHDIWPKMTIYRD